MIRKKPDGKYLKWYYDIQAKGRARKRAGRAKRGVLSVRTALDNLRLRYCQEVSFWTPHHRGKQGDLDGGLQWVDFVVRKKGKRPFVLILDDPKKRWKEYEKRYLETKQLELTERSIPFVLLPAGLSSQEYQVLIFMNMKRKGV
jgi:hypothetical protein